MFNDLNLKVYIAILDIIINVWYVLFILLVLYLFFKCIKPHKVIKNNEILKEVPSNLNIIEISNLVNRTINANTLSAYVHNLINRKIINVQISDGVEYLYKSINTNNLSLSDTSTLNLIFNVIGDGDRVTIQQLNIFCKRKRNKNILLQEWTLWCRVVKKDNYSHIFFETKEQYGLVRFFTSSGCALFLVNLILDYNLILAKYIIIPSILLLIIFNKVYKRTPAANIEFHKWLNYKKYLENIENYNVDPEKIESLIMHATCLGVKEVEEKISNHDYCKRITEGLNKSILKAILSGDRRLF